MKVVNLILDEDKQINHNNYPLFFALGTLFIHGFSVSNP
jgi:hypothetical protein